MWSADHSLRNAVLSVCVVRLTFRTETSHVVLARAWTGAVVFIPVPKIKRRNLNITNNSPSEQVPQYLRHTYLGRMGTIKI